MSASEKIQRNKKAVGFEDGSKVSPREARSRSRAAARDRRAKSMDVRSGGKDKHKDEVPRKRDRSLIGLVRQGSRKSVTSLVKLFEAGKSFYMTEGRKCQILLPDDRALEFLIQPKLFTHELLDIVASHFKLKEKDYFGLAFQDETGHWNWLQQDKKVLDHDLPRKQSSNLVIAFLVKYYVETITQLRDTATVELFYLCAKQSVFKGQIECDSETVFELAAHVLQASLGDYVDDETTKSDLKKLPLLTTSALKEHLSIQYCEERVIHYYKKISGTARGLAIVNYMTIVESLPTYGIHYFEVKDKKDIPWWLGISNKGIGVYDKQDKNVPRRLLVWKSLENLYYRDRKFSIEVHDPKRVSVSRRTFGPGNVNVHAWFGATPQLTKCVWSMAVAQHQFYHERKTSKATLPTVRSASELATALSTSTSSLTGSLGSDISRSGSSASLPSLGASTFNLNFDPADTAKVQREMYLALKARREQLEEALKKRTEELKMLCIKEGELTGVLPAETPLGPGEVPPQIRRRVGTAFSLSTYMVPDQNDQSEDETKKLQLELELQKQITNAAHKLASDKSVSRFVRKQRRHSFMKAQNKLKDMERKLSEHRKGSIPESPASSGKFDAKSIRSVEMTDSDSDVISPSQSPLVPRGPRSNFKQHEDRPGVSESSTHRSSPVSKHVEREIVSVTLPVPQPSSNSDDLYKANAVYSNQYRNHTYPTISGRSTAAGNQSDHVSKGTRPGQPMGSQEQLEMGLEGSRDSGFSSTNNMYNVNSRRTSRYESNQDLISPGDGHSEPADSVFDSKLLYQARHGSLDNAYQQSQTNYGSLERHGKKKSNREYERKLSDTDAISEASAGTTSESPFVKRTSKSEFDLSSKGRERDHPSSSSSKDTEFPMASQSNYSVNSIGSSRPGRYNSRDSHSSRADSTSARTESTSSRLNSSSGQRLIELPVKHEAGSANHRPVRNADYYSSQSGWRDTSRPEPSPIVQSPTRPTINEQPEAGDSQPEGQCYSPRSFEGHRVPQQSGNPQVEHFLNIRLPDSAHGVQAISSKIVKISPHVEVSKPFEMKDFYKYSEKLRRQRLVEQYHQALVGSRPSSPSQLLSEGENHSLSHHFHHGHQHPPGNSHPAYRGHHGNSVSNSPFGSPLSSRHMVSNYPYPTHSHSYDSLGQPNSHGDSVLSSSVSTTTYGVSTTTSRVQYTVQTQGGRVLYKAQHQSSKQTHYQPPSTYKCEPVRSKEMHKGSHEAPAATGQRTPQRQVHHQRQYSTPERSVVSPLNMTMSSFHLSPAGSLSKAFSNEMLEWYDGEGNQSPTSV
ncbi:FERM domain-containing protein 4A-like isoform X3 [Dreissena polymorpha]|uniref:FERM domain-containing protein 4A-like isoform X3 n=1 Tax=Dreissena polymorpha TaxID=45954 RepID=UPI002263ACD5|nr:FERM domain-containing protein 4A-like isoform X3 [Dreissena polymorpha]